MRICLDCYNLAGVCLVEFGVPSTGYSRTSRKAKPGYIRVNKGRQVDIFKYRHTAHFLEFPDTTTLLLHVTGASGFFQAEVKSRQDPLKSKKFVQKIPVG